MLPHASEGEGDRGRGREGGRKGEKERERKIERERERKRERESTRGKERERPRCQQTDQDYAFVAGVASADGECCTRKNADILPLSKGIQRRASRIH